MEKKHISDFFPLCCSVFSRAGSRFSTRNPAYPSHPPPADEIHSRSWKISGDSRSSQIRRWEEHWRKGAMKKKEKERNQWDEAAAARWKRWLWVELDTADWRLLIGCCRFIFRILETTMLITAKLLSSNVTNVREISQSASKLYLHYPP